MQDILQDIQQYNSQLTISQVVTFFGRKGLTVTKSMIQNYVRDGLLPPPINKRHYTHKHLAALALIDSLKTVYEMTAIKTVLLPFMDDEGIPLELYRECIRKTGEMATSWQENVAPVFSGENLFLMAHSVDLKDEALERLSQERVVQGMTIQGGLEDEEAMPV